MHGKFTLTCRACGCSAELNISPRPLATPYVCQSCGQELLPASHERLDAAMQALWALPEITPEEGFIPEDKGFQIKLTLSPSDRIVE